MSSYTRTVKTIYSSGGPGQNSYSETRTVTDRDGHRSETTRYGGDQQNGASRGFNTKFGNMNVSVGSGGVKTSISKPRKSRYGQGWGISKKAQSDSGEAIPLNGRVFEDIQRECLQRGILFEDPDFPAVDKTIFYSKAPPRPFVWKRPPELVSDPQFFVGGASRFDIQQGMLGDCWLLAAVSGLAGVKKLLAQVVPHDQDFKTNYAGVFHFRFWQYGRWTDVVIDDRLPSYNNKLVFMHSEEKNEFWSPLLEKAYAKLCGSYEALKGGSTCEAMTDFTGGVTEMFDFSSKVPPNLFKIMLKAFERNSLMGCSIDAKPGEIEAKGQMGLIMGHAYTITRVALVDIKTSRMEGQLPMVRIRNPWGNEAEWTGPWSDKSPEWTLISEEERQEHGLTFEDDGEFWMAFKDFVKYFKKLEICHLGPEALGDEGAKRKWSATMLNGHWAKNVNAGGCRNYLDTFWTNPQYRVEVIDPDEDDDDKMGTIIVGLMQKERRKMRELGLELLTMGYAIYKLEDSNSGLQGLEFFKYNASTAKSPAFINMREICGRHKLPPGTYCIVPSTFKPLEEGDFILRIFSEKENGGGEMDEETEMSEVKPKVEMTEKDHQQVDQMREVFRKISGDDMEVDAYELQDILNKAFMQEFKFDGFTADTCRSMVAMMDADHSGKLGFDEFKNLWTDLRLWKAVFKKFDKDRSGNMNSFELRQAFHAVGFKVRNQTFNALVLRYSRKDGKIHFDDFIHCVVRMKTMFEVYKEAQDGSKASFGLDEFIQTTMYS